MKSIPEIYLHCEKAFSADSLSRPFGEAIFKAKSAVTKDCFVVTPRNDDSLWLSIINILSKVYYLLLKRSEIENFNGLPG
jgi:hypothetical protein